MAAWLSFVWEKIVLISGNRWASGNFEGGHKWGDLQGGELFVPPSYTSHTNTQYTKHIIYALFTRYLRVTNAFFIFIFSSILFPYFLLYFMFLFTVSKKKRKDSKTGV